MRAKILAIVALGIAMTLPARAATNSWTDGTGKWEFGSNWSGGAPSISDSADLITNAGNNTVTIDAVTTNSPSTLTINNLTVGTSNRLSLANAGTVTPLHILNAATVTTGGAITLTNSALQIDGLPVAGVPQLSVIDSLLSMSNSLVTASHERVDGLNSAGFMTMAGGTNVTRLLEIGATGNGTVRVNGGQLNVTNHVDSFVSGVIDIGASGQGQLSVSGGTVLASSVVLGNGAGTGTVWVSGGQLFVTNEQVTGYAPSPTILWAAGGGGQMTISNGSVTAGSELVDNGTLTMAGGTNLMNLLGIPLNGSKGTVLMSGGQLTVTNAEYVGYGSGQGIFTMTGGTNTTPLLDIGNGGTGTVSVAGGQFNVTYPQNPNAGSSGRIDVGDYTLGQLIVSGGSVLANYIAIANPTGTGTVWVTGGQLVVTNNSNLSSSGPGGFIDIFGGGSGQMIVSNGTVIANAVRVATNGTAFFSVVGGNVIVGDQTLTNGFRVGTSVGSTGIVNFTGGSLVVTQGVMSVGVNGVGTVTATNSTLDLGQTEVASGSNSAGTITLQDGATMNVSSNLIVASGVGATGAVTMTGGSLFVPNGTIGVGNNGNLTGGSGSAQMTIANASVTAKGVNLGSSAGGHGIMTIQPGAILHITGGCAACGLSYNEGILDGGTIDATNADMFAGQTHAGEFISSNGVATVRSAFIGFDNLGSMTEVGGTLNVLSNLVVGTSLGATGIVTMTGGSVFVTNGVFAVGNGGSLLSTGGVGHVTLSNGVVESASILIGDNFGSDANLTVAGTSTVRAHGGLRSNGIRTTVVNGGTLEVVLGPSPAFEDPILHDRIVISYLADGKMIVSNGAVRAPGLVVAASAGNTGTLELDGGITSVYSNMTIGLVGCGSTGIVKVAGGSLFVTNGGSAMLEVRGGTFTFSAGTVIVDRLVITNACARFIRTGGALVYSSLLLDPNQSTAGDGIPNGWKLSHGLDPFDPNLGSEDADGDGLSNLQEYLAGTDPTNSASAFRITSVIKTGSDVRVIWTMGSNKTNALQFANGGNYTTNFTDLFTVTNTVGTLTNYLDVGGATNIPTRFYRVRLVL
ncbi:MAG TPA: thrombospondin type 3 repeat-containing protein [Verrucomicrobiae bacterium]|nr:thrombospondin type 3 repeat-containing protein [Verrucomicrobiae bacterium]